MIYNGNSSLSIKKIVLKTILQIIYILPIEYEITNKLNNYIIYL